MKVRRFILNKRNVNDLNSSLNKNELNNSINSMINHTHNAINSKRKISEDSYNHSDFMSEHTHKNNIQNKMKNKSTLKHTQGDEYDRLVKKDWVNDVLEDIPETTPRIVNQKTIKNNTKNKMSIFKRKNKRNARFSIVPLDLQCNVNIVDKSKIKRTTTSKKGKKENSTPSRNLDKERKNTEMSFAAQTKQLNGNKSIISNHRNTKIKQIIFKKSKQKQKVKINKNFSDMSTTSNKMNKSFMSNDSKKTKNSKSKLGAHIPSIADNENLGVIKEERKTVKRKISNSMTMIKKSPTSQNDDCKVISKHTIIKDGYLAAKTNGKATSRPSVYSMMSEDPDNREMICCDNFPSSTKELSSRSGAKYINTEEISENRRYDSNSSIGDSPGVDNDELEENKELERMIHQSFIRRSTDFDGTSTPMLAENASKRRPSSAHSRESFFIPHIFRRDTIQNKDDKKTPDSNKNVTNEKSKFSKVDDKSDESMAKLKIPHHPKGDQTSMTNIHSVFEDKITQKVTNIEENE